MHDSSQGTLEETGDLYNHLRKETLNIAERLWFSKLFCEDLPDKNPHQVKRRCVLHLEQSQVPSWLPTPPQVCFFCRNNNTSTPEPKAIGRPPCPSWPHAVLLLVLFLSLSFSLCISGPALRVSKVLSESNLFPQTSEWINGLKTYMWCSG